MVSPVNVSKYHEAYKSLNCKDLLIYISLNLYISFESSSFDASSSSFVELSRYSSSVISKVIRTVYFIPAKI